MKTLDLMLDLETLSLDSYAVIKQVSAVPFNLMSGRLPDFPVFDRLVNPISSAKLGAKIDGSTIEWWFKQDDAVIREVFIGAMLNGSPILEVLAAFSKYVEDLKEEHNIKTVYLWGNGVKADNVWLENQYKLANMKYPVSYREDMDLRTLVRIFKEFDCDKRDDVKFQGKKHNALDDCNHQIETLVVSMEALKSKIRIVP